MAIGSRIEQMRAQQELEEQRKRMLTQQRAPATTAQPQIESTLKTDSPSTGPSTGSKIQAAKMGIDMLGGGSEAGDTNTGSSALSGAATGALAGSAIAPGVGTVVGAGVGAIGGVMKARSARRQRKRDAIAKSEQAKAQIFQQQGAETNAALKNIIEGLRSAMVR